MREKPPAAAGRNPYLSDLAQELCADELVYQSGPGRGSRVITVRNDRLRFEIWPDRGMSIGRFEWAGINLSWLSPVGPIHPHRSEPEGDGWLWTFSGGAVVPCGLLQVGHISVDNGERLGLHGRAAGLQAFDVGVTQDPRSDGGPTLTASGTMREVRVVGEFLEWRRTIATTLGSPAVVITDTVTNQGYETSPFMFLHHMNFGYPLVSPQSRIVVPSRKTQPFDENAERYAQSWDVPTAPRAGEPERVYYHDVVADESGRGWAGIVNPTLAGGLGIRIDWPLAELDRLVQWNMFASGQYVTALEPGNCWTEGRGAERARGTLKSLEPGETWSADVRLTVVHGSEDIDALTRRWTRGREANQNPA